jgi:hypothetical protein
MSWDVYREISEEEYLRQQDIAAEEQFWEEADRKHTTLYNRGRRDGSKLSPPDSPDDCTYWQVYCFGLRKYWLRTLNLSVPEEF